MRNSQNLEYACGKPMKSFYKLKEVIESLQAKQHRLEENNLELAVRLSKLEQRGARQ